MNLQDRLLYHQIHPLKLATDLTTAAAAAALLWRHQLVPTIIVRCRARARCRART